MRSCSTFATLLNNTSFLLAYKAEICSWDPGFVNVKYFPVWNWPKYFLVSKQRFYYKSTCDFRVVYKNINVKWMYFRLYQLLMSVSYKITFGVLVFSHKWKSCCTLMRSAFSEQKNEMILYEKNVRDAGGVSHSSCVMCWCR